MNANNKNTSPQCPACHDTYWVCEEHEDKPWSGGMPEDFIQCCGGAGMPCLLCNPCDEFNAPRDLPDFTVLYDETGDKRH